MDGLSEIAGDYLDEEVLGDSDEHILEVAAHTLENPGRRTRAGASRDN